MPICLKCKPDYLRIYLWTDKAYSSVNPNCETENCIQSSLSYFEKMGCRHIDKVERINGSLDKRIDPFCASYHEVDMIENGKVIGRTYGCFICMQGYTGKSNNGYTEACFDMADFEDPCSKVKYLNAGPEWSKSTICH